MKNIFKSIVVFVLIFSFILPVNFIALSTKVSAEETINVSESVEIIPTDEKEKDIAPIVIDESTTKEKVVDEGPTTEASFDINMSVLNAEPILTQTPIMWEINWRCASISDPCLNAVINVTKPANMSLSETGVSEAGGESASSNSEYIVSSTADSTQAQFVFAPSVPAGTAGTAIVTFTSDFNKKGTIADGTIFTPVATLTASNTETVTAQASATVTSSLELKVLKTRLPSNTALNPTLDTNVNYQIQYADPRTDCSTPTAPGYAASRNVVITDTLPTGAVFVSASDGGIYNAGDNTVTWPEIDYVGFGSGCNTWFNRPYMVQVKYPSPTFNLESIVSNNVSIIGEMTGQPETTTSATDTATHGFTTPTQSTQFYKSACGGIDPCLIIPGRETDYYFSLYNTGNTPANFTLKDALPCDEVSPTFGSPCANPGFHVSGFGIWNNNLAMPITVNYTTTLGNSGSVTILNYQTIYPVTLGEGELVKDFTITGFIDGGEYLNIRAIGKVPTTYSHATQVNTASVEFNFGEGNVETIIDTGTLTIDAPRPNIYNFKNTVSGQVVGPGQSTVFSYDFLNDGEIGVNPVLTDLLPLGYEYVLGSVTNNGASDLPTVPTETVISNFMGTGRDLVRFTWPLEEKIGPTSNAYNKITFAAKVKANAAPATGFNTMQLGASDNTLATGCVYGNVLDTHDMDGDGSSIDYLCKSGYSGEEAIYTITSVAGILITKEVKGSLDSNFSLPPAMGHTTVSGTGEYKITVKNYGNVALTDTIAYDILPFIGDTGISGSQLANPRNSTFKVDVAGPLTGSDLSDATIEYSMSNNPCRGEIINGGSMTSGPVGCVNDWSSTFTDGARAVRVVFGNVLTVNGTKTFNIPFKVSGPAALDNMAWNSVAFSAKKEGSEVNLLPSEAQVVGLKISPAVPTNGSGSGGGNTSGSIPRLRGQVLGAETVNTNVCNLRIDTYMRKGYKNDKSQVKILQEFLNSNLGIHLTVDGDFGVKTELAVKDFQLKYKSTIMDPWGLTEPTGIVYKTTLVQIKNLMCPQSTLPIPTDLVNWSRGYKKIS